MASPTPSPAAAAPGTPSDDADTTEQRSTSGDALPALPPFDRAEVVLVSPDGERRVRVPVYVADSPDERARGLMGQESLPAGAGMLFRFPEDVSAGFWMKDTLLPLSIAFVDAGGEVLAVLDMEPCEREPCEVYDPGMSYRSALEVDQGFFDQAGAEVGWRLEQPSDLPQASQRRGRAGSGAAGRWAAVPRTGRPG